MARDRKLKVELTAHLGDKAEDYRAALLGIAAVLDQTLAHAIRNKVRRSLEESDSKTNYESPNLMPLLADQAGYRRALREVLDLLPPNN